MLNQCLPSMACHKSAVRITWLDGHSVGITPWRNLIFTPQPWLTMKDSFTSHRELERCSQIASLCDDTQILSCKSLNDNPQLPRALKSDQLSCPPCIPDYCQRISTHLSAWYYVTARSVEIMDSSVEIKYVGQNSYDVRTSQVTPSKVLSKQGR